MTIVPLLLIASAVAAQGGAEPSTMPEPIRRMVEAAIAGGNEGEINAIAKYARSTSPQSAPEIDRLVTEWRDRRQTAARERFQQARVYDLWTGQGDLGGTRTTGSSDTIGISAGLLLTRQGEDWRHRFRARFDYQETDDQVARDALLVAYEPRVQIDDAMFGYGLAQYDSDRFLGFDHRTSLSGGVGYRVAGPGPLTVDVDAGPAYRATHFTDGSDDGRLAARGSLALRWTVSEGVTFSNDSALVVDGANDTFATTASLDARLVGSLSARLSYNLQYESAPPVPRAGTGTISRATLVYDF